MQTSKMAGLRWTHLIVFCGGVVCIGASCGVGRGGAASGVAPRVDPGESATRIESTKPLALDYQLYEDATSALTPADITLVIETGLGDDRSGWGALAESLSALAPTFAYSRLGNGDSADAHGVRSSNAIAGELRELLRLQRCPRRYVLIGHSLGAVYAETFARIFPGEVAALVLVDPPVRALDRSLAPEAPFEPLPLMARALGSSGMMAEWKGRKRSFDEMESAGTLSPDLLLAVISAGNSVPDAPEIQQQIIAAQGRLAVRGARSLAPQGIATAENHIVAAHSGHDVHLDAPEVIVDVVTRVLAELRRTDR